MRQAAFFCFIILLFSFFAVPMLWAAETLSDKELEDVSGGITAAVFSTNKGRGWMGLSTSGNLNTSIVGNNTNNASKGATDVNNAQYVTIAKDHDQDGPAPTNRVQALNQGITIENSASDGGFFPGHHDTGGKGLVGAARDEGRVNLDKTVELDRSVSPRWQVTKGFGNSGDAIAADGNGINSDQPPPPGTANIQSSKNASFSENFQQDASSLQIMQANNQLGTSENLAFLFGGAFGLSANQNNSTRFNQGTSNFSNVRSSDRL